MSDVDVFEQDAIQQLANSASRFPDFYLIYKQCYSSLFVQNMRYKHHRIPTYGISILQLKRVIKFVGAKIFKFKACDLVASLAIP